MIGDRARANRQDILRDFEKLIEQRKLFGAARYPAIIDAAELDPTLVKKRGKGTRFSSARFLREQDCSDAGQSSSET